MELISRVCPSCGGEKTKEFISCQDYTVSKSIFKIDQCLTCSFIYTNPIPKEQNIGDYYKANEYISHSDTKKGFINRVYHVIREYTLKQKYELISNLNGNKTGSLLDIGTGTGYFLNYAKKKGWQVHGTEPDLTARTLAEAQCKLKLDQDVLNISDNKLYDIVTLWHVLEHVYHLNESIVKISQLLSSGGKLIIAVPNHQSYDAGYYKKFWAAYDVPRHLYHFSKETLQKLLEEKGFQLKEIKPMYFDSFYVSMISEQYRGTSKISSYLKGLSIGLISNLFGNKNQSSLTYIFEKKN